ncbi:MAG: carboxymuconolactone decarboxylase family protein [Gammaproteobacteria bacterium]|jgi:uncharacterized peroxidase-related enzyme|nr:carboxymuconolactone decarboxylase family protein [Gammaproteobacteria bacterium]MBT5406813.1 carboxymuconolactone decarboxylase family protein [Gammaproteobacteria bacterium]MBT7322332.1 carboxymuconolactone decarboxylase family protein [Gammaproteobacteria bacterium]MBT7931887.1 carboxymuconolactone decarboxylase family protein [Gammaproteobacteria bacterium]
MNNFKIHTIETAPDDSKEILKKVSDKYDFIPNALAIMAESPAMLDSYMTMNDIFEKTSLSETERQIILMTNANKNECTYCMAAHTTISQMAKVPDDVIESLRDNKPIKDAKLEALRKFAKIINETRGWPTKSDVDEFLAAGYNNEVILDIIVGTSIKVLSNYTNHVSNAKIDDVFEANAWSK